MIRSKETVLYAMKMCNVSEICGSIRIAQTLAQEMLASIKDIGSPLSFAEHQRGIGVWTDREQNQPYFYCCYDKSHPVYSFIFRIKIDEESSAENWESVGKLDFRCQHMTISQCGQYLWALNVNSQQQQIIFRQIDAKTLKYEEFKMPELDSLLKMDYARFYYTQNWGIFLIVECSPNQEADLEYIDVVFRCHLNNDRKQVYLEQIQLPGIPTVQPYIMSQDDLWSYKKSRYGIVDQPYSLTFYQLDYFGDVFVLEWSEFKSAEWAKFEVEGDKFGSWMALEDRDLSAHQNKMTTDQSNYSTNSLSGNDHCHLPNNILFCTDTYIEDDQRTHFYRCEFDMEGRVCKSTRIFTTCYEFNLYSQDSIINQAPCDKFLTFFLSKDFFGHGKTFSWEQVVVNNVPTLLNLTYFHAQQMSMKLKPSFSLASMMAKGKKKLASIGHMLKRPFTRNWQRTPPIVIKSHNIVNSWSFKVYKNGSNVCADKKVKRLFISNCLSVEELLGKFKNK